MRPVLTAAIAAALCLISIGAAKAADTVAVIINRTNLVDRLNESEIRKIYTNTTLSWPDGTPITIYDLSLQDPLRGLFSEKILGKTPDKVAEEWAHLKITNQAKNPPQAMKSESLIVRRVSKERGAIGYVSIGAVKNNQSIRIVNIIVEGN